jgi:hypothetical protein
MKCPRCGNKIQVIPPPESQAREVAWYRQHGRFPERIKYDGRGQLYVIGDQSWNMNHPSELIEGEMRAAGVYTEESL